MPKILNFIRRIPYHKVEAIWWDGSDEAFNLIQTMCTNTGHVATIKKDGLLYIYCKSGLKNYGQDHAKLIQGKPTNIWVYSTGTIRSATHKNFHRLYAMSDALRAEWRHPYSKKQQ